MVSVVQTAADLLEWSPRVHALASRGGWDRDGTWVPVPYVDAKAADACLMHIPQPKLHTVRYYGEYSSVAGSRLVNELAANTS